MNPLTPLKSAVIEVIDLSECDRALWRISKERPIKAQNIAESPIRILLKIPEKTDYTTDELFCAVDQYSKIPGLLIEGLNEQEKSFDIASLFEKTKLIYERSQKSSKSLELRFSIVSVFKVGRIKLLKKFLESLEALAFDRDRWELVLLVDGDFSASLDLEQSFSRVPNIRVYGVKKTDPNEFRVGSLRNLGASLARGAFLIFSDSDFWLSPMLLKSLDRQVSSDPVWLQPIRQQASKWLSFISGNHWRKFQDDRFEWSEMKNSWRWASSYCFCVAKSKFLEIGGFSGQFNRYGFEDSELAYRWKQRGWIFQKLKLPVLHLEGGPATFFSKFRLSYLELNYSAERFYRMYLDAEIYQSLFSFMGPNRLLRAFVLRWSRLPTLFWQSPIEFIENGFSRSPRQLVMGVKSRSRWAFAKNSRNLGLHLQRGADSVWSLIKLSFVKSALARLWYFYSFHFERNKKRMEVAGSTKLGLEETHREAAQPRLNVATKPVQVEEVESTNNEPSL